MKILQKTKNSLVLGLGCDRGTPQATIQRAIDEALQRICAGVDQVVAAASIDLKADEVGLLAACEQYNISLSFYAAEALAQVAVPNPSETVRKYTGTPSVSEAAALLQGGQLGGQEPALPMQALLLEKHKCKGDDGKNATVSIAVLPTADTPPAPERADVSDAERAALYKIIASRRDIRHFTPNAEVEDAVLMRILQAAYQAPSVGMMQPWCFIRITDAALRASIAELVLQERQKTAAALDQMEGEKRGDAFLSLKVEGVGEAAELLAVVLPPDDGTLFGRRTMPADMALVSLGCAVQNLWLAANAENLGLGWVSLIEPQPLAKLLALPDGARALGILCLGPMPERYSQPMLQAVGWRYPKPLKDLLFKNKWNTPYE